MKLKKQIILLLLIFVIGSSDCDLFSQNITTKPSRQSSFEAFSKGNFEQAYREFSELLLTYSKDPLYKYYSGVCLVNLNRDPGKAESLLILALQSATAVKTLPSDALFNLGRARQMQGKFIEALKSYNLYTEQVGKKAARELKVPDFVQQCNEKKGKVAESEKEEPRQTESNPVSNETILKPAEKDISVKENLPFGIDKILDDGLELQIKADSLTALVAEQKKQLEILPVAEKNLLKAKISDTEKVAASSQQAADQKYSEARAAVINSNLKQTGNKDVKIAVRQPDTIKVIATAINRPPEVFTNFEVLAKPSTNPAEKIKIDPEVPAGLIYRIQLAVFRNPVSPSYFKGITPIYGFKVTGTDKTNYFAGMFRRSSDAAKALAVVKAKGFRDAFVVALTGNKRVSADRAAVLEKEWGKKAFISILKAGPASPIDTITPTLAFRVEVTRSLKPLKDDVVEGINKMAGNRGLDIQSLDDGNIAYLIGKFITFETAAEYADLLIKNGYPEARVVAWMGKKEITVDTARQLFDNLK